MPGRTVMPGGRLAPPDPRPWGFAAAGWAVVLLAGLAAVFRTDDADLWFHLAAGRSIVAHGLPSVERWVVSAAGEKPWLPGWAFHPPLWAVFQAGGFAGLALWRAAFSAASVALALAIVRLIGVRDAWVLALAPLVVAVTRDRLNPRTEQVSVVLALFALLCFESARRGRGRVLWVVPAQLVWVNVHTSWILAPALAWLYALDAAWQGRRDSAFARRAGRWAGLGVALAGLVLFTPSSIRLRTVPLEFLGDLGRRDLLIASIEELRPWSLARDYAAPYTALLLLAALAALLGGRSAWRRSPPLAVVALVGLASGCSVYRMRAVAALLATPALLMALEATGARLRDRAARTTAGLAGVAGCAWLALAPGFTFGIEPQWRSFPVRAVALADSLGLDGVPLNSFHFGGYIQWVRGEGHPPLVDGRASAGSAFRSRFERASVDSTALDSLLAEWRCTHAILEPPRGATDRMAMALAARPDWTLIFADDAGLLFVQNDSYGALAAARGYRLVTPDYARLGARAREAVREPATRARLVAELERVRAESPWHAGAAFWLGLLALASGDPRQALARFDEVERLAPLTPGLAFRQGLAYRALGDLPAARRAFRRATREPADAGAAREALRALGGG